MTLEENIKQEQIELVKKVIEEGKISELGGGIVKKYESQLGSKFGVRYAVAVNSGTAALHCAIATLSDGEILVPATALPMTLQPLLERNMKIMLFDLDERCLDYDFEDMKSRITKDTKAILPVHLWGILPDVMKLRNVAKTYGLKVIEDACQAHGTRYNEMYAGTLFDIGCFSTQQSKILSTGEGGFILTDVPEYAERVLQFKNNNLGKKIENGFNYRITNMQAALGIIELKYMDEKLSCLRVNSDAFFQGLGDSSQFEPVIVEGHNNYNILLYYNGKDPERMHDDLTKEGIWTDKMRYRFGSVSLKNIKGHERQRCPNAEKNLVRVFNITNDWRKPAKIYFELGKKIRNN